MYIQIAKERSFEPDTIELLEGGKGHWFGPRNAEKLILFFHGGGYGLPCSPGHFHWAFDLSKSLQDEEHSISMVLLSYSLAPGATYPTQMKQACELIRYLLDKEHRKPSDLLIGGDSAGGNLTLAVLSHLLYPHPSIAPIRLSEPLCAAILISPWVSFDTESRSFYDNSLKDIIATPALKRFSKNFLGSALGDAYNQPVLAHSGWFDFLPDVVQSVLVYGGRQEILMDSIDEISKVLSKKHPRTVVLVQEDGAHEDMITDRLLGYDHKAVGTTWIEDYIKERMKQ